MLAKLTLSLLLSASLAASAQSGCPDPQATNYNPTATNNDGSCQYAVTTVALPLKTKLADEVPESSGLLYTGGQLWTFNDSGNAPVLFRVDSTDGHVVQRVRLTNVANVDWEDITADAQYVYVGDFGNNNGDRRDLRVLRVPKAALGAAADTASARAIAFSYPDQTDFTPRTNRHNFDCEAFFFANDSLHLFTKNWVDLQTRYYTIPAAPGTYVAHYKGTFNVNGLVTAAALNAPGSAASLLGYNASNGTTFLWLLSGFRNNQFLRANKRRIELPSALAIGQAEGLCFVDRYRVFVSNEQLNVPFFTVPAQLYSLAVGRWLAPTALAGRAASAAPSFIVVPNPAAHALHIERGSGPLEVVRLVLQDLQGRTVLTATLPANGQAQDVDLGTVRAGTYVLKLVGKQRTFSQKVTVE
ncbi:MAG: T9SS type A sorting domain-containing protein [Janthinobacterium lividum]